MEGGGGGGEGNRNSKISDMEKRHPRACQTLKGYQSTEGISKRNAFGVGNPVKVIPLK